MLTLADNLIIKTYIHEAREKGISNVTISNIAKICDCSRQTVYYRLGGVRGITKIILDYKNPEMGYNLCDGNGWKDDLFRFLRILKNNDWFVLELRADIFKKDMLKAHIEEVIRTDIVPKYLEQIPSGSPCSKEILTQYISYMLIGIINKWIEDKLEEDVETIMSNLNRFYGSAMHKALEDFLAFDN